MRANPQRKHRDRALAFEVYARQAGNVEAERRACHVRLRAEKTAGGLDKQREKAKGGQPYQATGSAPEPVERTPTLRDLSCRGVLHELGLSSGSGPVRFGRFRVLISPPPTQPHSLFPGETKG